MESNNMQINWYKDFQLEISLKNKLFVCLFISPPKNISDQVWVCAAILHKKKERKEFAYKRELFQIVIFQTNKQKNFSQILISPNLPADNGTQNYMYYNLNNFLTCVFVRVGTRGRHVVWLWCLSSPQLSIWRPWDVAVNCAGPLLASTSFSSWSEWPTSWPSFSCSTITLFSHTCSYSCSSGFGT